MFEANVIGNLGADVEIKSYNGKQFASFRIADSNVYTDENNVRHESTTWIDCTYQNVDAKILQYLKAGVKVFVRGRISLRVYSSAKERRMVPGAQVFVSSIELCGGSSDAVPRQVIDPDTGGLLAVTKHYWSDPAPFKIKKNASKELLDTRGRRYVMNASGFIEPLADNTGESSDQPSEAK